MTLHIHYNDAGAEVVHDHDRSGKLHLHIADGLVGWIVITVSDCQCGHKHGPWSKNANAETITLECALHCAPHHFTPRRS